MVVSKTTMQSWSKGVGLRFANEIVKAANIPPRAKVRVTAEPNKITITPLIEPTVLSLEDLFKDFSGKYELTDEDRQWLDSEPVGRERFWED
jgi:ribosomal protein S13